MYADGWRDAIQEVSRRWKPAGGLMEEEAWNQLLRELLVKPGTGRQSSPVALNAPAAGAGSAPAVGDNLPRRWCMAFHDHAPHVWNDFYDKNDYECRGRSHG